MKVRIPGWARNEAIPGNLYSFMDTESEKADLTVNGKAVKLHLENGYVSITRSWQKGDVVKLELPIEPRKVIASDSIASDHHKMAVERGPLMYAIEWPDVQDGKALNLIFEKDQQFEVENHPELFNGVYTINARAKLVTAKTDGGFDYGNEQIVKLIPYYAWNNRGPGEMAVWLPYSEESVRPLPAPTIASESKISASYPTKSLMALNDQLLPESSIDHTWPFYHWWPKNNSWEWVQYDFEKPATISSSKVYWFDDGPFGGCRIPAEWKLLYHDGNKWIPIKAKGGYTVTKDNWDVVEFDAVDASGLRMMIKLQDEFSAGIHEWAVN